MSELAASTSLAVLKADHGVELLPLVSKAVDDLSLSPTDWYDAEPCATRQVVRSRYRKLRELRSGGPVFTFRVYAAFGRMLFIQPWNVPGTFLAAGSHGYLGMWKSPEVANSSAPPSMPKDHRWSPLRRMSLENSFMSPVDASRSMK